MTDPRTAIGEARRIAGLWIGLLLAPTAFLINLEVGYALVPTACRSGRMLPLHLVHLVCLLLALLGILVAQRIRAPTDISGAEGNGHTTQARFMGRLGVAVGLLFALVIMSQAIPGFVLSPFQ
jgi:tetrahydromethanopterin S-methyltransferase subunit F